MVDVSLDVCDRMCYLSFLPGSLIQLYRSQAPRSVSFGLLQLAHVQTLNMLYNSSAWLKPAHFVCGLCTFVQATSLVTRN